MTRADFLIDLSILLLLFSHNHRVKSIRIINVDRVLPFHSNNRDNIKDINNVRERDINNAKNTIENPRKRLLLWSDLKTKNVGIGNFLPPYPSKIDRTFHAFGDVLGGVFRQTGDGGYNNL